MQSTIEYFLRWKNMKEKQDVENLFYIIQKAYEEFQDNPAYSKLCKNPNFPMTKNSVIDVLLSWEKATVIALEKLEIHLNIVEYGPDKEEALKFVDKNNPPFKYQETEKP